MLQGVAENFSSQEVEGMPGEAEIFCTPTHLLPFSPPLHSQHYVRCGWARNEQVHMPPGPEGRWLCLSADVRFCLTRYCVAWTNHTALSLSFFLGKVEMVTFAWL